MLACILFVLGAMVEYAGLLLKMKILSLRLPKKFELLSLEDDKQGFNGNNKVEKIAKQCEDKSYARLDIIFLTLFPLLFLSFNVVYWSSFQYKANNNNKNQFQSWNGKFLTELVKDDV